MLRALLVSLDRNRTWEHNEIDETQLCTTLFREECGDSSLLLSTVSTNLAVGSLFKLVVVQVI